MDFFLLWVLPALLLGGIGLIMLTGTMRNINRCKDVVNWTKTRAVVESSSVEKHQRPRYNAGIRQGYSSVYFSPKIEYSYTVMGTPFRSNGYQNFAGTYSATSKEEAAHIVADYPVGKEVSITYDPNNPADAYLLPETSTTKLEKSRKGQVAMLALALIWLGFGSILNLSLIFGEQAAEKRISESAGILPGTTAEMTAKLDPLIEKYQLTCQDDGTSGYTLAYHIWVCRASAGDEITSLEILNRKEDLEKLDMLSAIYTPIDQALTIAYFTEVSAQVFTDEELKSAQTWIAETVPQVTAGGANGSIFIGEIELKLDNLGGTLRLNIGDLQ